jgi:uncharacterized protein YdeI (YjbR/CyaY-like superfamily)
MDPISSSKPPMRAAYDNSERVSPLDTSRSIPMASAADFDGWLDAHGRSELEAVIAIDNKASGKQTVTLLALQEAALCHGWVDTQTKRIDDERYAVRFVPRRPGSNWSDKNRRMARRLLAEGRLTGAGGDSLPGDL